MKLYQTIFASAKKFPKSDKNLSNYLLCTYSNLYLFFPKDIQLLNEVVNKKIFLSFTVDDLEKIEIFKSAENKIKCFHNLLTGLIPRPAEAELRFLARNLATAFSAMSARSSASSNSCWTFRNLAKFKAAISSCKKQK